VNSDARFEIMNYSPPPGWPAFKILMRFYGCFLFFSMTFSLRLY